MVSAETRLLLETCVLLESLVSDPIPCEPNLFSQWNDINVLCNHLTR
jgi:hypothetical protein